MSKFSRNSLPEGFVVKTPVSSDGRLILGVGRGAFRYEMSRFGIDIADTREKFDESLEVLIALLTREEVACPCSAPPPPCSC